MVFVPGYSHDVFVSYAHVDDEPLIGAQRGWVTTLINNLETVVRQKLGFRDFRIWMDHQLAGNQPLTPAIMSALGNTATLLIILSPGYLSSEWCGRERTAFLRLVQGKRDACSQVFVVYSDNLDRGSVPAGGGAPLS
jgi:TIR domain